jgi:hypothetical protein
MPIINSVNQYGVSLDDFDHPRMKNDQLVKTIEEV